MPEPSPLGDFKPIAQRPASVEDRREAGHWEGDLIIGKSNRSAVATLVKRTSRQALTVALPGGHDAGSTAAAVTAALARQPRHLVRTPTWNQGREMARWAVIEDALGIDVYFCDPHSPWQRPTNEQTNGHAETAGCPEAPTSTSTRHVSLSSRTASTPCPANSTTGTQPTASTLPSVATSGRACPLSGAGGGCASR